MKGPTFQVVFSSSVHIYDSKYDHIRSPGGVWRTAGYRYKLNVLPSFVAELSFYPVNTHCWRENKAKAVKN